jgi:hypothetical protein
VVDIENFADWAESIRLASGRFSSKKKSQVVCRQRRAATKAAERRRTVER